MLTYSPKDVKLRDLYVKWENDGITYEELSTLEDLNYYKDVMAFAKKNGWPWPPTMAEGENDED